jgi:hypothetical protein
MSARPGSSSRSMRSVSCVWAQTVDAEVAFVPAAGDFVATGATVALVTGSCWTPPGARPLPGANLGSRPGISGRRSACLWRGNLQVARRLRAVLEDLLAIGPVARRAAVQDRLDLPQLALARAFTNPADAAEASVPDRQGIGSARLATR